MHCALVIFFNSCTGISNLNGETRRHDKEEKNSHQQHCDFIITFNKFDQTMTVMYVNAMTTTTDYLLTGYFTSLHSFLPNISQRLCCS